MVQINFSQTLLTDSVAENSTAANGKHEGILKIDHQDYQIFFFSDSEAVTEDVAKFLQESNEQTCPLKQLIDYTFTHITQEVIENEIEMMQFFQELDTHQALQKESSPKYTPSRTKSDYAQEKNDVPPLFSSNNTQSPTFANKRNEITYSSLFSLASSFHNSSSESRQKNKQEQSLQKKEVLKETHIISSSEQRKCETLLSQEYRYERDGHDKGNHDQQNEEDSQQGSHDQQNEEDAQHNSNKKEDNNKKVVSLKTIQANSQNPHQSQNASSKGKDLKLSSNDDSHHESNSALSSTPSVDSIFIRFMALMARILGQAEFEAHQLYLRIKERTDAIDVLTLFISKLNSEKSSIDWTKNEEMKKLVDKLRTLGVEIPEGKYKWSDDEKKLLKETVQMRKDSMEKMTQLERTDMQRYLQEASQCHQARSNTLKILKEVTDTIIHNMRPG